jgi:hypothetical protein
MTCIQQRDSSNALAAGKERSLRPRAHKILFNISYNALRDKVALLNIR